jgi:hypothetical protein
MQWMNQSGLLAMLRFDQSDGWQAAWGGDYGGCSEKRATRILSCTKVLECSCRPAFEA